MPITSSPQKDDLFDRLVLSLDQRFGGKDETSPDLGAWAVNNEIMLDGRKFTFKKHEYLIAPYSDTHPYQVEIKATQLGLTSKAMLRVFHTARYGGDKYRGIGYYFPSRTDVTDLSKTRIDPLIDDNPDTIGSWMKDTNAANVKIVWNTNLYLRGMRSRIGAKSVPLDFLVFDELDEAPPKSVDMILERMAHSEAGDKLFLSNPTLPDYGIDQLFCISPETKILTEDLRWVEAGSLKIGNSLIGFDEQKIPGNKCRRYRTTRVVSAKRVTLPSVKIYLDDGTTVICSKDHRWLNEKHGYVRFKITKNMKPGDKILSIGMWEEDHSKDAGWMAGIYDGEGTLGISKADSLKRRGLATYIGLSQNNGAVLEKVNTLLHRFGFLSRCSVGHKVGYSDNMMVMIKGGMPDKLRFMGTFRPVRLMENARILWEDRSVGNDGGYTKKLKIVKIEQLGLMPLIALGTEHKTFIANGLLSHNSLSDCQYWMLKCKKCNHYTNLVKTFPDCLIELRGGRVIRACEKCHNELDPSHGEWVAEYPSREEIRGRQFSQLYSQSKMTDPAAILSTFRRTTNMTDFYNLKIGVAYVEAQNRLSVQQVYDCCGDKGIVSSSDTGTFMGVDQGNNLHVVIGKNHPKRSGEVIHIGEYLGNQEKDGSGWLQLDELMNRFKVMRCVVDGLPETKHARAFAERFAGRVFLCFSNVHQKGSYRWDEKTMMVQANITETLDASHREISDRTILLPTKASDIMQTFAKHCHCIAKKLEEDEDTGSQRYVYIRKIGGPDHYRLSFNYFCMALHDAPELLFPEVL